MAIAESITRHGAPSFASIRLRVYASAAQRLKPPCGKWTPEDFKQTGPDTIEALRIGQNYQTTYGTLWKDGTYFPRGTRVMVAGLHLEQGFCVRFPAEVEGEPLETWEDWGEAEFLSEDGSIEDAEDLSAAVLAEAREVLDDAEDGTHLHLHESEE